MPTIQKSMRSPAALRGKPWRMSCCASASASARSSVASASSVIACVISVHRRVVLDVEHRQPLEHDCRATRNADGSVRPACCSRSTSAVTTARVGSPGGNIDSSAAWRRRTR